MRLATPPRRGTRRTHAGLTLIELIVAIAIAAILFTWAIPSFQRFSARNEVAAEVMRIRTALALTRNAAITRRKTVTLCPSTSLTHCEISSSGEGWKEELVIFEGDGKPGNAKLLRQLGASPLPLLTYRNDSLPVRYKALGRSTGHNGTFRICGRFDTGAKIIVSNFGRVRITHERPAC